MMLEVLKIMMVYFTTNLTTVIKYLYFVLAFIFVFFQINVIHAFNLIIYKDIPRRVWSVMSSWICIISQKGSEKKSHTTKYHKIP